MTPASDSMTPSIGLKTTALLAMLLHATAGLASPTPGGFSYFGRFLQRPVVRAVLEGTPEGRSLVRSWLGRALRSESDFNALEYRLLQSRGSERLARFESRLREIEGDLRLSLTARPILNEETLLKTLSRKHLAGILPARSPRFIREEPSLASALRHERMGYIDARKDRDFVLAALERRTSLEGASLPVADLSGLRLEGGPILVLSGADLRFADLSHIRLRGSFSRSADFRAADLRHADLRSADLPGALFSGADLRHADLRGARLAGADFRSARLTGARYNSETVLPFSRREARALGMKAVR